MGRVSKAQATRNRQSVVEGAARLFQQHGLKGIAIADLMAEAGLTHGGFYRQFASKDEVAGEACAHSMQRAVQHWQAIAARHSPETCVSAIADAYLTANPATHRCPMPMLAADVAREAPGSPVREAFTGGVADLADVLTACLPDAENLPGAADAPPRRERALGLLAALVGAVALARATDDETFSNDIRNAVRHLAAAL